jgi:DNA-directed RNA polymerase specialized sigma24 family protein
MSTEVCQLIEECAASRRDEPWRELLERFTEAIEKGVSRGLRRCGRGAAGHDREDLRQEVYCKLLEHDARALRQCRGCTEQEVRAYLARIAERVVRDAVRATMAEKRGGGLLRECGAGETLSHLACSRPSPERCAERAEAGRRFLAGCRAVLGRRAAGRELTILYLAVIEDWSSPEICRRLGAGLTPGRVDSLVHRSRRRLAAHGVVVPRRRLAAGPAGALS